MSSQRLIGRATSLASAVLLAVGLCGPANIAQAGGIGAGNLVVVRVGDGAAALSSAASAVFLEERLQSDGSIVSTLPLPTAVAGAQRRLTVTGTAASEAYLTRSSNGQYLVITGYDAPVGQLTVSATTSAVANRVIGRITIADGAIDTSTALSDLTFNTGNPRSATSDDGTRFWCSGTGNTGANGGVRFVASLGAASSTQVSAAATNTRVLNIFNDGSQNQLFVSSAAGMFHGISTVGSGLPTSGFPVAITILPGFPVAAGPSSYDFFFANPTTVYVADDRALPNGGIQKWTLIAGTWTLAYTLNTGLANGCRGLTGFINNTGNAVLYATTSNTSANSIVFVSDIGAAAMFSTLTTAPTNTAFRGLRLIPAGGVIPCPANIVNTGTSINRVDVDDLLAVISGWGPCPAPPATCPANIVNSGTSANRVDVDDLLAVIGAWGPCP